MAIRVTQLGHEVWVNNPSNIRVTQIGGEVWLHNVGNIRVTQIGQEVWLQIRSNIRVTQIGLETWRTTPNMPQSMQGNADGFAVVWGITPQAQLTAGHADGYAEVASVNFVPPLSPIILDMGI